MYKIIFHSLVEKKDLKDLNKKDQERILKAIYKKLTYNPEEFGKYLSGELKGYFRLRVGEYRVVYSIKKKEVTVFVLKIGARKDFLVYLEAVKRLKIL